MKKRSNYRVPISGKDIETIESIEKVLKRFEKKQVSLSQAVRFTLKTLETNYRSDNCNKVIKKLIVAASKIAKEKERLKQEK
jgi:hypothetical protein